MFNMPEWTCAECKWHKEYTHAKEHMEQHGTYNKWIRNLRIQSFQKLSQEKNIVASFAKVERSVEGMGTEILLVVDATLTSTPRRFNWGRYWDV